MTTTRWGRLTLEEPPAQPKVRWGRTELGGSALVVPHLRWGRMTLEGPAAVIIQPLADQTVEPGSVVTVSGVMEGGSPDSWTFRRISGPSIGIVGTGATRTFVAPFTMAGGVVVVGVTATKDGTTSPERTAAITVLPQVTWAWNGSAFIGSRLTYLS